MIDKVVQEQVAACLAAEIPQEVQDEVARTKAELDIAQRELHNSSVFDYFPVAAMITLGHMVDQSEPSSQ